jgi:hypothetical protein
MAIDGAAVLQGLILVVAAWAGNGIRRANEKLNAMAERLAGIEAWKASVDQRHAENLERMEGIRQEMHESCRYPDCPAGRLWNGEERRKSS